MTQTKPSQTVSHTSASLAWLNQIKGLALIWIVVNHVAERLFGFPLWANPAAGWPPLSERLAQLQPLSGNGVWDIPLNLLRYLGWSGDQGVQLFLIASGFGLTWGLLHRPSAPLALRDFYRRRLSRIYPLWWGAHLLFLPLGLVAGIGLSLTDASFWFSLLGIRLTPGQLYYFAPAWWYMGLIVQLYLIYPLLWKALRRIGPARLLIAACVAGFVIRAIGLLALDAYLDAWARGAIFVTRLPEFVFGIALAAWLHRDPVAAHRRLHSRRALLLAALAYALGAVLAIDVLGMTVAPFLLGAAAFVVLYAFLAPAHPSTAQRSTQSALTWVGERSYALYLMHHPFVILLVPFGLEAGALQTIGGIGAAVAMTIAGAMVLERAVGAAQRAVSGRGPRRAAVSLAVGAAAGYGALLAGDLLVQHFDPQEVFGWGERPSLQPDDAFGWKLIPSSETLLRWESYDYVVTANALGFPGPEPGVSKPQGTRRILAVGDAFTSAEGVDTDQAWPRLLERELASTVRVEVLNFGITGYGPNQYAAVIDAYAPAYRPDVLVIGFFVNDYQDALTSDDQFRESIGFGRSDPNGAPAALTLADLRQWIDLRAAQPLKAWLRGEPNPHGYFLGNFGQFERDRPDLEIDGRAAAAERLDQIGQTARRIGAKVVVVLIPASIQVCRPDQLDYYPSNIDVTDAARFDLERPQRVATELAAERGFGYYDLRNTLRTAPDCVYQPRNMHWTAEGHRVAAAYLADRLVADGYVMP